MNYYLQVITFIAINGLLGLSVYLVLSTGQLTLGNAGFMAIGAYAAALLVTKAGWPIAVAIPAGALLASAVAVPLGYACLRLRGVYLAVATLGFSQTVVVLAQNLEVTGGALGVKNIPNLANLLQRNLRAWLSGAPLGLTFSQAANLLVTLGMLLLVALALVFVIRQARGRVGRAYTAIRTDEIAAAAMGMHTTYYKVLAFAQGAFLAGLGGGLYAHVNFGIGPADFGFSRAVEMLAYVVIGGSMLPAGPILGAALLALLSEGLRSVGDYRLILYGALMMVMMMLRPQGILRPRVRRRSGKGRAAV